MSKNFELLRQAGAAQDLFQTPSSVPSPAEQEGDKESPLVSIISEAQLRLGWPGRLPESTKRQVREKEAEVQDNQHRSDLESLAREEVFKLIQRVFLMPGPSARQVVVFSGVNGDNGCTSVCARAAQTLASQVKGSVCVVDANLRSPSLHHYFGVGNLKGFAEALLHSHPIRDVAQQLAGSNLWCVPSGTASPDPHALLMPDRMRPWIGELRRQFDYVLIAGEPFSVHTDAISLSQFTDGVVLLVEADSTRRDTARKIKSSLETANIPLLGVVLNNRQFPIPESIYRKL